MISFPPEAVLVPTDLSETSMVALRYARWLHETYGARVTVLHAELHVLRATDGDDAEVARCPGVTDAMRARCTVVEKTLRGNPVSSFLAGARESRADLVVLGGEHPGSLLAEITSTTTDQVLRKMATPLIVVPE